MIGPDAGKAWLGIALFMIITSIILLFSTEPNSAPFVVSSLSLCTGVVLLVSLVLLIRKSQK
jgi:hypothetical protein